MVLIDDSPMELAEVKAEHPEIECILFPQDDPRLFPSLCTRCAIFSARVLFPKRILSGAKAFAHHTNDTNKMKISRDRLTILRQSDAELTLNFAKEPLDPRALELVNKTNQFNLNGKRFTEGGWKNFVDRERIRFS